MLPRNRSGSEAIHGFGGLTKLARRLQVHIPKWPGGLALAQALV
jgi:hypothetical protein